MSPDPILYTPETSYEDLKRAYRVRGFAGESHDMVVLRRGQVWRLLNGAEPSWALSTGARFLRYGVYN